MIVHSLKTWPEYFKAVIRGEKTFEIRKNDRNYQVGDTLELKEYDPAIKKYTGRSTLFEVTYILDKQPFVPEGYACMGIRGIIK
jgi:ribosomal protein S17